MAGAVDRSVVQRLMNAAKCKGAIVFLFEEGKLHMTTAGINNAIGEDMEKLGTALATITHSMLQEQKAAEQAERFKFDPTRDPNYKEWT